MEGTTPLATFIHIFSHSFPKIYIVVFWWILVFFRLYLAGCTTYTIIDPDMIPQWALATFVDMHLKNF